MHARAEMMGVVHSRAAELATEVDDGRMQLDDATMQNKFRALGDEVDNFPKAVGTPINMLGGASGLGGFGGLGLGGLQGLGGCGGGLGGLGAGGLDGLGGIGGFGPLGHGGPASSSTGEGQIQPWAGSGGNFGFTVNFKEPNALPKAPAGANAGTSQGGADLPPSTGRAGRKSGRVQTPTKVGTGPASPAASRVAASPLGVAGPGAKKGPGRKPDDPMKLAPQQIEAWGNTDASDINFFGAGSKSHTSFLKRIKDKLEAKTHAETEADEVHKITLLYKEMVVVCDIRACYMKHGLQSQLLIELIDSKLEYLAMAPFVVKKIPLPTFIRKGHREQKAIKALTGPDFWLELSDAKLTESCTGKQEFKQERTRIATLRVVSLTRTDPTGAAVHSLLDMASTADVSIKDAVELPDDLSSLKVIAQAAIGKALPPNNEIEEAHRLSQLVDHPLLHALHTFPAGRNILLLAKKQQSTNERSNTTISQLKVRIVEIVTGRVTISALELFFDDFENIPEEERMLIINQIGLELQRANNCLRDLIVNIMKEGFQKLSNDVISLQAWADATPIVNGINIQNLLRTLQQRGGKFTEIAKMAGSDVKWFDIIESCTMVFGDASIPRSEQGGYNLLRLFYMFVSSSLILLSYLSCGIMFIRFRKTMFTPGSIRNVCFESSIIIHSVGVIYTIRMVLFIRFAYVI